MKTIECHACREGRVEVEDDYEEEMCCSGLDEQCGCYGMPVNPVFCDTCSSKIFGDEGQDE